MMRRTTIRVVGNFLEISGFSRSRRSGIGAGWCRRHCFGLEARARRSIPHVELCEFSAVQQKFRGGRLPGAAVRDMLARMTHSFLVSRRSFLAVVSTLVPAAAAADVIRADFPSHEPELVQEMVLVSHNNVARVKELVGRQPALAKVSFDWGFGDWETPIDAASHMGNREIAEFLIANGARPTIFSAAMLGQLDVVKSAIVASPGV